MSNVLIKMDNIKKYYRSGSDTVSALQEITLQIGRGESAAVMGASGSGKSTLLSIVGGLNRPSGGEILIDDLDLYALPGERLADFRREYIGFVFQQFQLIPYLTALENVLLPLTTAGYSRPEKYERALNALERVSMTGRKNHLPNQLSGGEQERVAIARAIVNEPPLVLADEPTGSLDSRTAGEIMELFQDLGESGLTILMVTHNPENAAYMQRLITMQDGLVTDDSKKPEPLASGRIALAGNAGGVR